MMYWSNLDNIPTPGIPQAFDKLHAAFQVAGIWRQWLILGSYGGRGVGGNLNKLPHVHGEAGRNQETTLFFVYVADQEKAFEALCCV